MDKRLRRKILEMIMPTEAEHRKLKETINILKKNTWATLEETEYDVSFIEEQGSTGIKQTYLRGNGDIDLFIALNLQKYKNTLNFISKSKLIKSTKNLFLKLCQDVFIPSLEKSKATNIELAYAEHPYVSARIGQFNIDMVGCFDLDEDYIKEYGPITAVDRTPHHSRFIKNNLTNEMKNDVRILKVFFQASHIYGDKSALGRFGFTGFSAELLIYHFKNLENLFNNFTKIPSKPIDFFNRSIDELKKIKRFRNDYFILIDPVDKNRNVAASISRRAFKYAELRINQFNKNPSIDFFIKKDIPTDIKLNEEEKDHFVVVEFESDGSRHYTEVRDKLYKLANSIKSNLEYESTRELRFGPTIFEVYFEDLSFALTFYCQKGKISKKYKRKGPYIKDRINFKKFITKYPNYFIEKNRAYVILNRKFILPIELVSDYLNTHDLFSGIKFKYINNIGITEIGKKSLYIMKELVIPIELKKY